MKRHRIPLATVVLAVCLFLGSITVANATTTRTICADGSYSSSSGSGTCSWHGGIAGGASSGGSGNWDLNLPVTLCNDGTYSGSTGSGTCSWHGGIAGGGGGGGGGDYYTPLGGSSWRGYRFASPSGGIQCRYEPRRSRVGCSSLNSGVTGWISTRFYPWRRYSVMTGRAAAIPYGDYWSMGGFTCYSETNGMWCYSPGSSDGIKVDRTGVSFL